MIFSALYPELIVEDMERSKHFYIDTIGFKVEYDRPEERFYFLSLGGAQLLLLEDNENQHSRTGELAYPRGQGVNFSIAVPAVSGIAKSLTMNNYPLRIPIRDQWHRHDQIEHGERQLWVMDPDGYLLRFIEELGTRALTATCND